MKKKKRRTRRNKLTPKRRILIICEGTTEEIYFKGLNASPKFNQNNAIKLEVENPKKNDPHGLVKTALKKSKEANKEGNSFDKVFVVFDKENDQSNNLEWAFDLAIKNNISIGFSSIAFEYWFLIHFDKRRIAFQNCDDLIDYIKNNYWPEYQKTKLNHFEKLKDKLEQALNNAEWLKDQMKEDYNNSNGIHELNPYVTVDELVVFLQNY